MNKEQYRERLTAICDEAMNVPLTEEEKGTSCYWPSQRQRELAADAVAVQVLRDCTKWLWDASSWHPLTRGEIKDSIERFAAERGIDLGDES